MSHWLHCVGYLDHRSSGDMDTVHLLWVPQVHLPDSVSIRQVDLELDDGTGKNRSVKAPDSSSAARDCLGTGFLFASIYCGYLWMGWRHKWGKSPRLRTHEHAVRNSLGRILLPHATIQV